MWDAILQGIFEVVKWCYLFAHDWGLAILMITVIFRIVIYPITRKQFQSQYKMQKLQPKITEIRAKYAGDPQRMNEEMMRVYQEGKYNPLTGCIPMLLQMPIAIALFWVLRDLPKFAGNSDLAPGTYEPFCFYGLIPDLTKTPAAMFAEGGITLALPYIILLLLFGVSMLLPILINKNTERNQLIMFGVMAVVMLFFGWSMPAGLLLYWDASTLASIGQQFVSRKMLEAKDAAKEDEIIEVVPVKVEVERKTKKNRPKKSK